MTSIVNIPSPVDDVAGRSALALLACRSQAARALYLVSRGHATVADSSGNAANCRISIGRAGSLPFLSGTFDVVVLDLDAAATYKIGGVSPGTLVSEITRVMRRDAECLVLTRSTGIRRNLSALLKYRIRPDTRAWNAVFAASSFYATSAGHLITDDSRVLEVRPPSAGHPPAAAARRSCDYTLTSFRREDPSRATVLEKVLDEVGCRMDAHEPARLVTMLVRKIGKTAVVARAAGRRVIIRIPRTAVARARAERNFRALERLHRSDVLTPAQRALIPEPLLEGCCYDYPYYVEQIVDGDPRDERSQSSWEPGALQFITSLHLKTRQYHIVTEELYQAQFADPVRRIHQFTCLAGSGDSSVFARLIDAMRVVIGERLPFVWSHGDFALGNCLYASSGHLSAVVDWELFAAEGLPLLDLLQCMPVPGESNSHPRWQRFDAIADLLGRDPSVQSNRELAQYARDLGLPRTVMPVLLMMHWVDHVANRIEGRRSDRVWMDRRVLQPLRTLDSLIAAQPQFEICGR